MNNTIKFFVDKKNSELRVDVYLSKKIGEFTRSYIKKIVKGNKVLINNEIINNPSAKVKINDEISVDLHIEESQSKIKSNNIALNIIFEDKDILIVNKPKGMVVHPGAGNFENTLAILLSTSTLKEKDLLSPFAKKG